MTALPRSFLALYLTSSKYSLRHNFRLFSKSGITKQPQFLNYNLSPSVSSQPQYSVVLFVKFHETFFSGKANKHMNKREAFCYSSFGEWPWVISAFSSSKLPACDLRISAFIEMNSLCHATKQDLVFIPNRFSREGEKERKKRMLCLDSWH